MSRNEAAAAGLPAENELLRKLDEKLRERATTMVDQALKDAEAKSTRMVAEDLSAVSGHVIKSDVIRHFSEAFSRIRANAIERTYDGLLQRVINQLTDGKSVDLT